MDNRTIRLDQAIEAVRNIPPEWARSGPFADSTTVTIKQAEAALSALPAAEGCGSLQQCMNELNATKDALAEAVARIAELENEADDRDDAYRYPPRD